MDGIAIIDKPEGWTSHDVVARARRLFGERRVGHTGTLDPFATGVLVVLVGRATRLAQFLSGAEKEYEALVRFGYATDTGDATGEVTVRTPCAKPFEEYEIENALASLRGEIEQVPPMYSAKKVKGQKLYELARRGEEVEREPVRVCVREFEAVRQGGALVVCNEVEGTCDLRARVVCSAGTYVRALAESLGERLGASAHLAALRRTRAGEFHIKDAHTLEELTEEASAGRAEQKLLPLDAALPGMPEAHLTEAEAARARHGAPVRADASLAAALADGAHVRLRDERGRLMAVGVYEAARGQLRTRVLLALEEGK